MISESELLGLMGDLESFRVERTVAVNDVAKFSEAICAFANDLPASGKPGYLLIGVDDKTGVPCGLTVTDQLLQILAGLANASNFPRQTSYRNPVIAADGAIGAHVSAVSDCYNDFQKLARKIAEGMAIDL